MEASTNLSDSRTVSVMPENVLPTRLDITSEDAVTSSCYLTDDSLIALGQENGMINIIASNKGK